MIVLSYISATMISYPMVEYGAFGFLERFIFKLRLILFITNNFVFSTIRQMHYIHYKLAFYQLFFNHYLFSNFLFVFYFFYLSDNLSVKMSDILFMRFVELIIRHVVC